MNILLIGSGGREHALAWKISQSPRTAKLFIAPGNAGTAKVGENIPIEAVNISGLLLFAKENAIDLVVVGPDNPLALGIVDAMKKENLLVFGPEAGAAKIESSKAFSKDLMSKEGIPTAKFKTFETYKDASEYVGGANLPVVIKASGLALGKGVIIAKTKEQAEEALKYIMVDHAFGEAGDEVVIEEYLEGDEVSFHAFSDGVSHVMMPTAQDHKPVGEGDEGPNTGGMGTIAPVPWVTKDLVREVEASVVVKALEGMKKSGTPFAGCLYPGLMITKSGPKVLEFNARFGDPETQSYMRLLKSDLVDVLEACAKGTLGDIKVEWRKGFAATVVIASGGYPDGYKKGLPVSGLEEAEREEGVIVFHAGTKEEGGAIVTSGGRVLGVTGIGATLKEALDRAYKGVGKIQFEGMYYRKDIGQKALKKHGSA